MGGLLAREALGLRGASGAVESLRSYVEPLDLWVPLQLWGASETVGNFGVP